MNLIVKAKAKREQIAKLREERGATDPILVIAAIAVSLVLLVGGSFAVAGIITNGHNLNAKGDLDKVSVAQVANYAEFDSYVAYEKGVNTVLEDSGVGFTPTEGGNLIAQVNVGGAAWAAASQSASNDGNVYIKTSESGSIIEIESDGSKTPGQSSPATLADLGLTATEAAALYTAVTQ